MGMQQRAHGRAARGSARLVAIILLGGFVFAVANVMVLMMTVKGAVQVPPLAEFYHLCAPCLTYFVAAPLVVAVLVAIMVSQRAAAPPAAASGTPAAAALRLLAVLQQEGRLIDFLEEDISVYGDAQVGAAVRAIHAGCRKALHERAELQRILSGADGSPVVIEPGFDPAAVRLSGNVSGRPPFQGVLQHGGWRITKISLPQSPGGTDPQIIAPAEVDIA
jgi:Domain of unknown function (DUF2760)